jgi:hypothetical protein
MANTKITNPELFNLGANNTAATQLPVRTTTERTAMTGLSDGEMIFNSDTDKVEYWDGTKWYGITYNTPISVQYLVVAGGGGTGTGTFSGGAGAGGYLTGTITVSKNALIPVTVGLGGSAATAGNTYSNVGVSNGYNSIFDSITATGGGFGSTYVKNSGSGGSGGGEAAQYTHLVGTGIPGQGFNGGPGPGNTTGGGGGASSIGGTGGYTGGYGGDGKNTSILTQAMASSSSVGQVISGGVYFSGGGGGSKGYSSGGPGIGGSGGGGGIAGNGLPTNGTPNTGGGGGGGGGQAATVGGASGGSGVVILRHSTGLNIATVGLTKTTFQAGGGEEVTIITAGTGTIEFT